MLKIKWENDFHFGGPISLLLIQPSNIAHLNYKAFEKKRSIHRIPLYQISVDQTHLETTWNFTEVLRNIHQNAETI